MTVYSFTYNGLTFGNGTPFSVTNVDGLEALPQLRTQDDNQGYNDGMFSGRDFVSARTIVFDFIVTAGNGNSAQQNLALLSSALIPQSNGTSGGVSALPRLTFQLSVTDPVQWLFARVRDRKVAVDPEYTYGFIRVQVTFFAPDPRIYSTPTGGGTVVLTPGTPNGTRTYNLTFNRNYSTTSTSTTLTNAGTWSTAPSIVLTGPFSSATISNTTTNTSLTIASQIYAGDVLTIDCLNRFITYTPAGGVAQPARNLVTASSTWPTLNVGANVFTFTASTSGSPTATITYSNATI
jgi:hypothetical protein